MADIKKPTPQGVTCRTARPQTLTYHTFRDIHCQKTRTNNERISKEIRQRTRVAGVSSEGQSCLNLKAARKSLDDAR